MQVCPNCSGQCTLAHNPGGPDCAYLDRVTLAVKAISDLMTHTGLINLDFADFRSVILGGGIAAFGVGEASGPDRIRLATDAAVLDLKRSLAAQRSKGQGTS